MHNDGVVSDFEQKMQDAYDKQKSGNSVTPMKHGRGRLFLTGRGVQKVFERSSKDVSNLQTQLLDMGFIANRMSPASEPIPAPEPESGLFIPPDAIPAQLTGDVKPMVNVEFGYQALRNLLNDLKTTEDPHLRILAIEAAELATGRDLQNLKARYGPQREPASKAIPLVVQDRIPSTSGPLFTEEGWYGFKQIGEKAGGYAAAVAGKAADVVAGRHGYTGKQIRTTLTPFNNLPMLPDTTTGKLRRMYRFDKEFSNEVIVELRTNARFKPEDTPSLGATLSIGASRNLSEGPL